MIFNLYSYRDQLNGFGPILLESNEQTAVRGFSMAINNGNGKIGRASCRERVCLSV